MMVICRPTMVCQWGPSPGPFGFNFSKVKDGETSRTASVEQIHH